jgi:formylglycine-generating enzyme required for sulfatase activity
MKRLNGIVQEFAPKLGDYPGLLAYAERVGRALREPQSLTPEEREQVFVVGDRQLHLPDGILTPTPPPGFPPLQTVGFDVATIADDTSPTPQPPPLRREPHVFEVATIALQELPIDRSRKKKKRQPQRLVSVQRDRRADWQYVATLGDGVELELVRIPGGSFPMGSPDTELERFDREGPQHRVTVAEFFMGKYAVTQSQWRVVAAMETVNRELDPNPSRFQGEDRPVERVSWLEAVEFCDRLSRHTGRTYRPPTEAEWEYACRAGTETPFHFGSTITPALANYNGNYTYADEPKGEYRGQTTPVGSFGVANSFGLYDIAIRSDL